MICAKCKCQTAEVRNLLIRKGDKKQKMVCMSCFERLTVVKRVKLGKQFV